MQRCNPSAWPMMLVYLIGLKALHALTCFADSCQLACIKHGRLVSYYGTVANGNRCNNRPESFDVCIDGKCRVSKSKALLIKANSMNLSPVKKQVLIGGYGEPFQCFSRVLALFWCAFSKNIERSMLLFFVTPFALSSLRFLGFKDVPWLYSSRDSPPSGDLPNMSRNFFFFFIHDNFEISVT